MFKFRMSSYLKSLHKGLIILIVWCLTLFSTVSQLYHGGQCTYPSFLGILLTSTPQNILSKPLAAFPQNHCQNNGQQWERNECCCNDYHQSLERILAELEIEPATSCSQVRNTKDWAMGLSHYTKGCFVKIKPHHEKAILATGWKLLIISNFHKCNLWLCIHYELFWATKAFDITKIFFSYFSIFSQNIPQL